MDDCYITSHKQKFATLCCSNGSFAGTVSIDVCISTTHRHFYQHVSNGFMHVALRQSDLIINFLWETYKPPSWFVNAKAYSLLHFNYSSGKAKQSMEIESTALGRQRETTCYEGKGSGTVLELSSTFSLVVLKRACSLVSSSKFRVDCKTPFWNFF